jgi:hypothetical protein
VRLPASYRRRRASTGRESLRSADPETAGSFHIGEFPFAQGSDPVVLARNFEDWGLASGGPWTLALPDDLN